MGAVTVDVAGQLLSRRVSNDHETAMMLLAGLRRSLAHDAITDELPRDQSRFFADRSFRSTIRCS